MLQYTLTKMSRVSFTEFIQRVKSYNPSTDEEKLAHAFEFASLVHNGQKRLNNQPFTDHCLGVANYLAELRADGDTLVAALLHDTLEYSNLKPRDLITDFGQAVAKLVEGVTTIQPLEEKGSTAAQIENLRKMFLAMAKDIRVVLIRLAEKLDNLDIIDFFPESEGKIFAERILSIYSPLAERLGLSVFKRQLEEKAFAYLYPSKYQEIKKGLSVRQANQQEYIERLKHKLLRSLAENNIKKTEIFGRGKTVYSVYQKLAKYKASEGLQEDDISRIYDQIGITILVDNVVDCYVALGVVHGLFKHLPEEFDDYIATPKSNGYQSIQTTVFAQDSKIVEIQIKTFEMHEYNEFGPASHVYYKLYGSNRLFDANKIGWIKELARWQQQVNSPQEFAEGLKLDFFADRIFCFTPRGDIKDLPAGATPIDFGYSVHTGMGSLVVGAKVNGKVVSLDTKLKNGDVVELTVSKDKNKKPSRDWLKFVLTTTARKKIKKAYALE